MKTVNEYIDEINFINAQIERFKKQLEKVEADAYRDHSPLKIGDQFKGKTSMGQIDCTAQVKDFDVRVQNDALHFFYEARKVNKNGTIANIHVYESRTVKGEDRSGHGAVQVWNTGRLYQKNGQIIAAVATNRGIFFNDVSRMVDGFVPTKGREDDKNVRQVTMRGYDCADKLNSAYDSDTTVISIADAGEILRMLRSKAVEWAKHNAFNDLSR